MKFKLLLASFAFFGFAYQALAQCTPDPQYTAQGIYPDTITNLPHATVGQAYSTVITVVVPEDTMVTDPLPLTLDVVDFVLDTIKDLPPGFTYECYPNTCVWPGNSSGCVLITGPALSPNDAGTYEVYIKIIANFTSIIGPITRQGRIRGYYLVVNNSITTGGYEMLNANLFELAQNIPNPATNETTIKFTSPTQAEMELNIYNAMGQVVMHRKVSAEKGINEVLISTAELPNGMYIYTLNNGIKTLNSRMIVAHK